MKISKKIILLIIFLYIIIINLIPLLLVESSYYLIEEKSSNGEELVLVDSVEVTVKKQRFYGTILESHSDRKVSTLYLLDFIKIPLYNGFNFLYLHIAFIMVIAYLLYLSHKKNIKEEIYLPKNEELA